MMKKPMLNAIQKVKMAMKKKPKMAMKKKPKMAMPKKPKFNSKLKAAAKSGKLDKNPKFKAAVEKAKMSMKKKPKMAMKKKPMLSKKKTVKKLTKASKKMDQALVARLTGNLKKAKRKGKAAVRKGVKGGAISVADAKVMKKGIKNLKG
jgi:hypothetical protein|tara:strand:- start:246 stop:692 length:447 start_codon:yes stop_codon:yes gene_type:complete